MFFVALFWVAAIFNRLVFYFPSSALQDLCIKRVHCSDVKSAVLRACGYFVSGVPKPALRLVGHSLYFYWGGGEKKALYWLSRAAPEKVASRLSRLRKRPAGKAGIAKRRRRSNFPLINDLSSRSETGLMLTDRPRIPICPWCNRAALRAFRPTASDTPSQIKVKADDQTA